MQADRFTIKSQEALQAAIEALEETDHTRLPAHIVAEIVLRVADQVMHGERCARPSSRLHRPAPLRAV